LLPAGLSEDVRQGAWRDVLAAVCRDRHQTGLLVVLELLVPAGLSHLTSALVHEPADHFPRRHNLAVRNAKQLYLRGRRRGRLALRAVRSWLRETRPPIPFRWL